MAQCTGSVKWFNNAKGYGFLGCEGEPDTFVHFSAIIQDGFRTLAEGDLVTFTIVQGAKGKPQAEQVTRIVTQPK